MTDEWIKKKNPLACAVIAATLALSACGSDDDDNEAPAPAPETEISISLEQIGRYVDDGNGFDEGSAEIIAYDADAALLFVVNAEANRVDVLDVQDPTAPASIDTIDASANWTDAGGINSISVSNGLVAVAVEHDTKTEPGRVQIYNSADRAFRAQATVGSLPDMVIFNHDGSRVLVANEGEPNADYSEDPEGSVSIVNVIDPDNPATATVGFAEFNVGGSRENDLPEGVRIFGNFGVVGLTVSNFADTDPAVLEVSDASALGANEWFTLASSEGDPLPYQIASINGNELTLTTDFDGDSEVVDATEAGLTVYPHLAGSSVAQDLEPEYIAISPDGTKAWATLQENNAVAIIDIASASVDKIIALGTKDYSVEGNEIDPSDKDGGAHIATWPIKGMYMPDTITSIGIGGQAYYLTANEGDAREYDAFVEEIRFEDAPREGDAGGADFGDETKLGRIATTLTADTDGNGSLDQPFVFGARSFSIWAAGGSLVADSGSDFEMITVEQLGGDFNSDNDGNNSGDSRSDAKGPEPEAIAVGTIGDKTFAFIGLERVGGIMVYDISNPETPKFVQYITNRDFDFDIETRIDDGGEPAHLAGDLGPESIVFISAADSPNHKPMLAVGNEISGSTTFYTINVSEVEVE